MSDPLEKERIAAAEAWQKVVPYIIGTLAGIAMVALLGSCTYIDAAHAMKEEGKSRLAIVNSHYAEDVADLAKTIPAGALARYPSGAEKCALAALAGLQLVECQYVTIPGWVR